MLAQTDCRNPVLEFPSTSEGKSVLNVKAVITERGDGVMIIALNSPPSGLG